MAMLALSPSSRACRPVSCLGVAPSRVSRSSCIPSSCIPSSCIPSSCISCIPRACLGSQFVTGGLLRLTPRIVPAKARGGAAAVVVTSSLSSLIPTSPGMQSLYIAVGIPLVLGFADSLFNSPLQKWYFDLKKPKWQPPGPIFGGAWSLLYPLMGLASWLVWVEGGFAKQAVPLTLYVVQLGLNLAWQALFFGAKRLGAAFYDIVALDVVLVATIVAFQRVNPIAANLLKPYLAWVLFATALSWRLWDLNRDLTVGSSSPPPAAPAT